VSDHTPQVRCCDYSCSHFHSPRFEVKSFMDEQLRIKEEMKLAEAVGSGQKRLPQRPLFRVRCLITYAVNFPLLRIEVKSFMEEQLRIKEEMKLAEAEREMAVFEAARTAKYSEEAATREEEKQAREKREYLRQVMEENKKVGLKRARKLGSKKECRVPVKLAARTGVPLS
jgi:hypothetical protein